MEWDSRMKDTHVVQVLKTAIPFFDVSVGEQIDVEGLLSAVHSFTVGRERQILEFILQFFQIRHMMDMMQLVQSMQQAQEQTETTSGESGDFFDLLKTMMSAMYQPDDASFPFGEQANQEGGEDESVDL